jgi:hypothetical protein
MGRDTGHRISAWAVAMALVALVPLGVTGAAAAPRKGTTLAKAPPLAQSGHASFWSCPAKTTEMLVAVSTVTLHPGATLTISFTVRNGGAASCNYTAPYAGVEPGPTSTALTAGPCGSVTFEVLDAHRNDAWPGAEVVNCPALGFARLAAGATVSGTGSWNVDKPNSAHRVAPGAYTLLVANKHFRFPLRVTKS